MIKYFLTRQFFGFLVVGGVAALLHWLTRILLSVWLSFSSAVIIAYVIGMSVAFLLNSYFIFPRSEKARHAQARDFIWVNLSFFPIVWLASLMINHFLKLIGMVSHTEELAHALAISLPMFATFLIYKFFTFKDKDYEKQ